MMTDPVAAEHAIRQLHARYADAVWRKDADAFAACFTPDGEWRIAGMALKGRTDIAQTITGILATAIRVLITFRTPLVAVTGQGVSARTYVTEQCSWHDRPAFTTIGRYFDRCVQHEDRWLFEWRLFQTLYLGPADLSGTWYDHEDYGPAPAMPPRDAIPPA